MWNCFRSFELIVNVDELFVVYSMKRSEELEIARSENEILKREVKNLEKALEEKEIKVLIFHIFFRYMHTKKRFV